MNKKMIISALAATAILAGCSSTPKTELPDWYLNPISEDGLVQNECVNFSGNISVDQKMVVANARVGLAQQINTKVKAMDKTYSRRVDAEGMTNTGSTFESVSKQLTDQSLTGSKAIKFAMAKVKGNEVYCTRVALNPAESKRLFDAIVENSKRELNPNDEAFMYEEFKAHKAQEELEKEMSNLGK